MKSETPQRLEGGRRIRAYQGEERPLVSIVVVLFRDREECIRLLENICAFDHHDFELVVIDGGSDDGTPEVLKEWSDKIDYWLSEPDSGIYDAMNKGILAARGGYILHLNAGDTLLSIPTETLAECLREDVEVASFAVKTDKGEIFRPQTGPFLRIFNTWHHQGTFYRRDSQILYDTTYRIYADFDRNQRIYKSGKTVRLFDQVVSVHGTEGLSHKEQNEYENYRSIWNNFGIRFVVLRYVWPRYQRLRRLAKRTLDHGRSLVGK